jgi:hypothetical protein
LTQRNAEADAQIDMVGGDEIKITGNRGAPATSTIEVLRTTATDVAFAYRLEDVTQPADLVIAPETPGSIELGGDGTFQVTDPARILLGVSDSPGALTLTAASGSQTYLGAVELLQDTTLESGGDVSFSSTVDTGEDLDPGEERRLEVNASGTTAFAGAVGTQSALQGLTVGTPGATGASGGIDFSGAGRVVTGAGGISLKPQDRNAVEDPEATLYSRDPLSFETSGDFETGRYEKLSVVGGLDIQANTVRVGDISAFGIDVDAATIELLARDEGGQQQVADYVANDIRFSTLPSIDYTGTAAPVVTLATDDGAVRTPGVLSDFEVRLIRPDGSEVSAADFLDEETVLDLTPTGPLAVGDPSSVTPQETVQVAALLEPRFGAEGPSMVTSRPGAAEMLAFLECAQPPGAGAVSNDCLALMAAAGAAPARLDDPAFATERAHEVVALYRRITDPDPQAQQLRDALARAADDYHQLGAPAGVGGAAFYHFLERSPHHAQALETLDLLAFLLAQVRLMDLAEDDFQQVERALAEQFLAATPGDELSADALLEAVHTSHTSVLR